MPSPPLGRYAIGAAGLGNLYAPMSDERAHAVLEAAWDCGVRYFDTAPHYGLGLSERRLGAFLATKPRQEYVVSTKVGRVLERNLPRQRMTMDDLYASMATRGEAGPPDGSPAEVAVHRIDQANRRFVAMYRQNTALMALFEQVTTFDPEVRAQRQAARERNVGRVRHSIEQLQRDGLVAADLDAEYAAHARVAMVNGAVHYWLVLDGDFEEERLVATLTRLWAQALGLPVRT